MGLSITQILFTVVAIVLAWRVIGFLERRQKTARPRTPPEAPAPREVADTVELAPCPRCATFIPKGQPCPHCAANRQKGAS